MWGDGSDGMGDGSLWVCGIERRTKMGEGILQVAWMDFWGKVKFIVLKVTKKRGGTKKNVKQTRSFCLGHVLFSVVGRSFF